ncbi:helix-turn-helix transcriptional regulator [Erwinia sp. HDF1-3R]|uniref:helix-turn-helix domain-containing protein n=1 Tax=Erwinia TaxID=551 RepID=UPI0031F51045
MYKSLLLRVGVTIRQLRRRKGLSQLDLSHLAHMDRSYLSEVENGKRNISLSSLVRIAQALDVSAEILIDKG